MLLKQKMLSNSYFSINIKTNEIIVWAIRTMICMFESTLISESTLM